MGGGSLPPAPSTTSAIAVTNEVTSVRKIECYVRTDTPTNFVEQVPLVCWECLYGGATLLTLHNQ